MAPIVASQVDQCQICPADLQEGIDNAAQRGRFGRDFVEISPRGTTDGRPTFTLHYLLLHAGQQDKVDIDQLN